jgi:hypothetical protein
VENQPTTDPAHAPAGHPGHVVHVLGRASDEIVAHVAVVTRTLAAGGLQQSVVLLDDARGRTLLTRFDADVQLVLASAQRPAWRQPAALLEALADAQRGQRAAAVHLHGLAPGLLGIFAAKFRGLPAPLHLTLYGAGAWKYPSGAFMWLLRRCLPRVEAIMPGRAGPLPLPARIDIVEGTVDEVFYTATRREARQPLVVASTRGADPRAAARYAQLAVLLHDAPQPPGFNWIGPADATSLAQLAAAGIGQFDPPDALRRAARLRSAWLYVAAGDSGGFPAGLVEAMALGLPCIAWATPAHRAVIRHGETGLLCESIDALLTGVANLVDSPTYRTRLGTAARLEALRRFHPVGVSNALLASYQAASAAAPPPHPVVDAADAATAGSPPVAQQLLPVDR